jgi:hypothetical protein
MNLKQAEKLLKLFNEGYHIEIDGSGYVDSDFRIRVATDDDELEEHQIPIVFDSSVEYGHSLSEVGVSKVKVYKKIDWLNENI